jgi:NitT/TauT family transport system substrate-binding protein
MINQEWFRPAIVCIGLTLAACGSTAAPGSPAASAPVSTSPAPAAASASGAAKPAPAVSSAAPAASANPAAKPAGQPVAFKAGTLGLVTDAPLVIANQRGYLKDAGLQYSTQPVTVTQDALPLLATGQLAMMSGGINPALFNVIARGVDVHIVAGATFAPGLDTLGVIVRKDLVDSGRYKSIADLKGMKIGVPANYSVVHYLIKLALEKQGLSLKDVEIVPAGTADALAALANKALDADANVEPFVTQAEKQNIGKVVFRTLDITSVFPGTAVMMSPDFQSKEPAAAQAAMVAYLRGTREYMDLIKSAEGRQQLVELMAKENIKINPDVQNSAFARDAKFDPNSLVGVLEFYTQQGQIQGKVELNKVIDFSLIDKANQVLGP